MLNRMRDCIADGNTRDALIIGQNLFAHNPDNREVFDIFYSVLWSLASSANNSEEKLRYFQQLSSVLTAFSEAVILDNSTIEYIKSKENSLSLLFNDVQECKLQEKRAFVKEKIIQNDECLKNANRIIDQISKASNKPEFDSKLRELQKCDSKIDKAYLSDRQQREYDCATQKCTQLVDKKVRQFEREKNNEYNMKALEAYGKVFNYFKENKNCDNHKEIISGLFEYDSTRLYNETLAYYNHVYSYILSKLNDEEKFILTKAAIYCDARRWKDE